MWIVKGWVWLARPLTAGKRQSTMAQVPESVLKKQKRDQELLATVAQSKKKSKEVRRAKAPLESAACSGSCACVLGLTGKERV